MAITEARPEAAGSGSPELRSGQHPIMQWLFTMHGTTMIFLFVIPMLAGLGNYIVPLQIGALDMAFPRVNALSLWMLPLAGIVLFSGYFTGGAACAGWTEYPTVSLQPCGSSTAATDLWIVALLLVGTSSILGAVNFITTIFNMRTPGMTMFRMPLFSWTMLVTSLLVLLATGIVSDVLPVFSRKPLFGYKAFVFATAGIGALGFSVWAHHMFATGAVLLPFFSAMTFLIAVPTGVKFFNWIATMWRGKIHFTTAMLFAIGFLTMFLVGGIDGMFLASPVVDFGLTETYWVVAHIHYVLFGGSVFGVY